jgi:hypothetical protein
MYAMIREEPLGRTNLNELKEYIEDTRDIAFDYG